MFISNDLFFRAFGGLHGKLAKRLDADPQTNVAHVKSSKKVEKNPVGVYGVIYSRLVSTKNGMSAKQNA